MSEARTSGPDVAGADELVEVLRRLVRIEALLERLDRAKPSKEWYTTAEAAEALGKRPFTVREWCRLRRVHAEKRDCGRGVDGEWMISHVELERIQNYGLLTQET